MFLAWSHCQSSVQWLALLGSLLDCICEYQLLLLFLQKEGALTYMY